MMHTWTKDLHFPVQLSYYNCILISPYLMLIMTQVGEEKRTLFAIMPAKFSPWLDIPRFSLSLISRHPHRAITQILLTASTSTSTSPFFFALVCG